MQYSVRRSEEYQHPLTDCVSVHMCTFLLFFPILYVYSLIVQTHTLVFPPFALLRKHDSIMVSGDITDVT